MVRYESNPRKPTLRYVGPRLGLPPQESLMRATSSSKITTSIDDCFRQVSRALKGIAAGPEAFARLLGLLSSHFDTGNTGTGYTKPQIFGVPHETPLRDFS